MIQPGRVEEEEGDPTNPGLQAHPKAFNSAFGSAHESHAVPEQAPQFGMHGTMHPATPVSEAGVPAKPDLQTQKPELGEAFVS